jgi:RNA polymerase sigma-70 factor (ECF subfamily)
LLRKRRREAERRVSPDLAVTEAAESLSDRTPSPDCLTAHAEVQQQVESALEQLTPLERAAFTLRHLEGKPIAEISTALGVGTNAAKQSIFRAVQKLRRVLEPMRRPVR